MKRILQETKHKRGKQKKKERTSFLRWRWSWREKELHYSLLKEKKESRQRNLTRIALSRIGIVWVHASIYSRSRMCMYTAKRGGLSPLPLYSGLSLSFPSWMHACHAIQMNFHPLHAPKFSCCLIFLYFYCLLLYRKSITWSLSQKEKEEEKKDGQGKISSRET